MSAAFTEALAIFVVALLVFAWRLRKEFNKQERPKRSA